MRKRKRGTLSAFNVEMFNNRGKIKEIDDYLNQMLKNNQLKRKWIIKKYDSGKKSWLNSSPMIKHRLSIWYVII